MRTINFSDARRHLKEVLDRVVEDADVTIITRRDSDDVVVMSLNEYNSWKETEYLLSSPANARHLRDSVARLDAGQKIYRDLVEAQPLLAVREAKTAYRAKAKAKRKTAGTRAKKRG